MISPAARELDTSAPTAWNAPAVAKKKDDLIVVVTSVGTEEQALDVAHALVRSRRAACVNIVPNVHSVYRWKGRVCDDGEMLLIVKTRASQFDGVRETIHRVNTYELPEILGYRVDMASPGFAAWIDKMTTARVRAKAPKAVPVKPATKRSKPKARRPKA
jgi:periplasmic divalent cation tolerance protein